MSATHSHKVSSWVTVGLIIVASTILGFAFVLHSIALTVIGGVLMLAGFILGAAGHIMDDAY